MMTAAVGTVLLGWSGASRWAYAFPIDVAEAPSTTLSLTLSSIQGARESILLNIYELTSPDIADALIERINAGVHVEVLEEGQPVGGLSAAGRGIQAQLVQAMRLAGRADRLYEMTSHAKSKRRFRFDHGKYAVIDGERLLIGSENYSPTGNPRPGTPGNRGWEVLLHDRAITEEYRMVFQGDIDMNRGDLLDLTVDGVPCGAGIPGNAKCGPIPLLDLSYLWGLIQEQKIQLPVPSSKEVVQPLAPWSKPTRLEADTVQKVTSPDTSESGLIAMINSARRTLDLEQMTFHPTWSTGSVEDADQTAGGDGETWQSQAITRPKPSRQSPLVDAVLAAARRGVKVRVLLNDEVVFDHPGRPSIHKNELTVTLLKQIAQRERLPLEAEIANLRAMGVSYIHNKGALVDGARTLVSSINWNENSLLNNREAAVLVDSRTVNAHYQQLFDGDWSRSQPKKQGAPAAAVQGSSNVVIVSEPCPDHLHVLAWIGNLRLDDPEEASFSGLSGARIEADFERQEDVHSCTLVEVGSTEHHSKHRYVQIRNRAGDSRSVALEGYTNSGLLYSIRAQAKGLGDKALNGKFPAIVYNGSGPSREKLGSALIETFEDSR
jgi:cardiolipin synthase